MTKEALQAAGTVTCGGKKLPVCVKSGGDLSRTYIHGPQGMLADVTGSTPASGTWNFFYHDHQGSIVHTRDGDQAHVGYGLFWPWGEAYTSNGTLGDYRYTGHRWDGAAGAGLYRAPYRAYYPKMRRWTRRDPLGMVDGPNVYGYVGCEPIHRFDRLGLRITDTIPGHDSYTDQPPGGSVFCALRLGKEALDPSNWNDPDVVGTGGDKAQHCYVACRIEKECGNGMGSVAAYFIEILEMADGDGRSYDSADVDAGLFGADGGEDCEDCDDKCRERYP